MSRRGERRRRAAELGPLHLEITDEDIMGALAYPAPPPGQWRLPPRGPEAHTGHVDELLRSLERALWVGA